MTVQRELSPKAQEDLIEIWSYIAQFSEEAADKIIDTIYQKADSLARSPYMGKERSELYPNLRSFPVEKYIQLIDEGYFTPADVLKWFDNAFWFVQN